MKALSLCAPSGSCHLLSTSMALRSGTHCLRGHPSLCLPVHLPGCGAVSLGRRHPLQHWAASWRRLRRVRHNVCLSTDSTELPGPAPPKRARRKARNATSEDTGAQAPGGTPSPPDGLNVVLADPPAATISQPPRPRRRTAKTPAPVQGLEETPSAADGQGTVLPDANNPVPATPRPSRRGGAARGDGAAQGRQVTPSNPDSMDATSVHLDRCEILSQRCMQLLGVGLKPSEAVRKLINKQPAEVLITNLKGMLEEFGPELTAAILKKRPQAVVGSCKTLATRVQGIKDVLCEGKDDELAKVLRKHPEVLSFQPATLAQKVQDMSKLLDLSREDAVRLLIHAETALKYSSETLVGKVAEFSRVLGLDRATCCSIIKRSPVYMGYSADCLQSKFVAMAAMLGSEDEARKAVIRAPTVLSCTPEYQQAKMQALAALFGPTKAVQIVRTHPSLLGCTIDTVASKWKSLESLCAQVPRWDGELRNLSANCTATSLTYSQKRHVRFAALIEAGAADVMGMYHTLTMTPEDFQAKLEATVGRRWVEDVWHGRLAQPDVLADIGSRAVNHEHQIMSPEP